MEKVRPELKNLKKENAEIKETHQIYCTSLSQFSNVIIFVTIEYILHRWNPKEMGDFTFILYIFKVKSACYTIIFEGFVFVYLGFYVAFNTVQLKVLYQVDNCICYICNETMYNIIWDILLLKVSHQHCL